MGFVRKLSPFSERSLSKNEEKALPPFWVCDIESNEWVNFVTIGLTNGEQFWHFEDLGAFFEFLTLDGKSKTIYAHFGGKFDFQFLLNHLFFADGFRVENMIPRGSGLLCFDVLVEIANRHVIKLIFRDSSAMLPFGLKSLTKNFRVETMKQEWDHSKTGKVATPELIEYCKADCIGLHQVIEKYHSWPIIKRAGSASTIAGQAMRVLRTFMDVEVYSLSPKVDRFVREGYFGGRTEIFKPLFLGPGKIRCADVNSLYPTVMRELPEVSAVPREYPNKFDYFTYEYEPERIGFYEAEVEVPEDLYIPPLGTKWEVDGEKKFIFPVGRFSGTWSTMELEYARSLGVKILKTEKGAVFKSSGNFFKDYVDRLYEIRETSERESVDNVLAKLLLNSCYGRFGLKVDRENLVVDQGQEGVKLGEDESAYILTRGDESVRLAREAKHLETFNAVAVAAWVTSASRIYMHRLYMKNPSHVYYTDTDSMFTDLEFGDEKGLGGLKLEYEGEAACWLLPKTYIVKGLKGYKQKKKLTDSFITDVPMWLSEAADLLGVSETELLELNPWVEKKKKIPQTKELKFYSDHKITMKGFDRKKTSRFTMDDFMMALEGDLKRLATRHDAKFATFKTALGREKLLTMIDPVIRQLRSQYTKRILFKGFRGWDSRPHLIKDGQPIETKAYRQKKALALAGGVSDLDDLFSVKQHEEG